MENDSAVLSWRKTSAKKTGSPVLCVWLCPRPFVLPHHKRKRYRALHLPLLSDQRRYDSPVSLLYAHKNQRSCSRCSRTVHGPYLPPQPLVPSGTADYDTGLEELRCLGKTYNKRTAAGRMLCGFCGGAAGRPDFVTDNSQRIINVCLTVAPVDHIFYRALFQLIDSFESFGVIVFYSVVDPIQNQSEAFAFVITDQKSFILIC